MCPRNGVDVPVPPGLLQPRFTMHKIGDEQWTGLTDELTLAGTRPAPANVLNGGELFCRFS